MASAAVPAKNWTTALVAGSCPPCSRRSLQDMGDAGPTSILRHPGQHDPDDGSAEQRQGDAQLRGERLEVLAVPVEGDQGGPVDRQPEQGDDDAGDRAGGDPEEGEPVQWIGIGQPGAEHALHRAAGKTREVASQGHCRRGLPSERHPSIPPGRCLTGAVECAGPN